MSTTDARTSGRVLVAGTTSDAGKTVVTTGLCRVLARRGYRVAPFKAQNMSNNSMVTLDDEEIGRAQWVQALAAGAEPEATMNPVLLKPGSDRRSHVVVMGRPHGLLEAGEFAGGRAELAKAAFAAFDDLSTRFDMVVCEGAGSPAEINLRGDDYVNMGLAQHAQIPTILVGDIDRGGVFASMYGTLALLDEADQRLMSGFVVNKFRGDVDLLRPGLDTLERLTGRPVFGVLPWQRDMWLDSEDALAIADRPGPAPAGRGEKIRVAVVLLPRISNFTDVDALCAEPNLEVTFVDTPRAVASADVIVLPGTRSTLEDLRWLRERGLADALDAHASRGGVVLGICGGFQMLGRSVQDPEGVEGAPGAHSVGLGLLAANTVFGGEKVLRRPTGEALGVTASGYEIHHGRVAVLGDEEFLGGARRGAVFGTMWHGSLEGDALRRAWLAEVASISGRDDFEVGATSFHTLRQERIDALADAVERHLDIEAVIALMTDGAPRGAVVIRGGLA